MANEWSDLTTSVVEATHPTVAFASIDICVIEGPDQSTTVRMSPGTTRIGSGPSNQLRLSDRAVSRMHCELRLRKNVVQVVDAGSTNDTFVDGLRVSDAQLVPGSTLRIGATTLRIESSTEPMHVPISARSHFGAVLGGSLAMRRVYAIMDRLAASETTALILGETGTGKELVARAVHDASGCATGPFVTVDCGAIAESLIESELFGHVRGSFSGAFVDRKGLFEEASGGTLFLDEVGELPLSLQPKLLRVLEERTVRRVGGNASKPVHVRVLAATNRSLAESVNEGSFREDLYYRLAVIEIELPPLRARREDIETIAQHFYQRFTGTEDRLPDALLSALHTRAWPGNVRELRNFIERSITLGCGVRGGGAGGGDPLPDALLALIPTHLPLREARGAWTEQFERLYVEALLRRTNGNVTRAAEIAGVHRRSLQRLIASLPGRSVASPEAEEEGHAGSDAKNEDEPLARSRDTES